MTQTDSPEMACAVDIAELVRHLMRQDEWACEPFDVYSGLRALLLTAAPRIDDLWLVLLGVLFDEHYDGDPEARQLARRISQRPTKVLHAAFVEVRHALHLLREKHHLQPITSEARASRA